MTAEILKDEVAARGKYQNMEKNECFQFYSPLFHSLDKPRKQ